MYHIETPEAMFLLGKELAKDHHILLLSWELWAGKTLLTKWFAAWLGLDDTLVQSPTYTYINIYDNKLLHVDMYRLPEEKDMIEKWIHEQLHLYPYVVVEWPKFITQLPFDSYTHVLIEKTDTWRIVTVEKKTR